MRPLVHGGQLPQRRAPPERLPAAQALGQLPLLHLHTAPHPLRSAHPPEGTPLTHHEDAIVYLLRPHPHCSSGISEPLCHPLCMACKPRSTAELLSTSMNCLSCCSLVTNKVPDALSHLLIVNAPGQALQPLRVGLPAHRLQPGQGDRRQLTCIDASSASQNKEPLPMESSRHRQPCRPSR